jgi:hypothetical protein
VQWHGSGTNPGPENRVDLPIRLASSGVSNAWGTYKVGWAVTASATHPCPTCSLRRARQLQHNILLCIIATWGGPLYMTLPNQRSRHTPITQHTCCSLCGATRGPSDACMLVPATVSCARRCTVTYCCSAGNSASYIPPLQSGSATIAPPFSQHLGRCDC